MVESILIRRSSVQDVDKIYELIYNIHLLEPSIFRRFRTDILIRLDSFLVAQDIKDEIIGCIAVHHHFGTVGEIRSLVVKPDFQNLGLGSELLKTAIRMTCDEGLLKVLWLDTQKPLFFAKQGFCISSRLQMPIQIILTKISWVFQQPISRWYASLTGSFTPMYLNLAKLEVQSTEHLEKFKTY